MEAYKSGRGLRNLISLPILWFQIVPLVLADICAEIYHRVCFPLYGLECVKRSEYIRIDRHKLSYLNWYQKLGCVYCGYANGLLAYLKEIAGQTEKYWCGIMHKQGGDFHPQKHQKDFLPYGDKKAFRDFMKR